MSLASEISVANTTKTTPFKGASMARLRRLDSALELAIFLVCAGYLCLFLRYSSLELDEGIVLEGAERVLHGEIPYRDFFTFYTPGSFYLVAMAFRVFGDSFVVARFSIAVCGALCSVLTYALTRRVCSRGISIFCAMLATLAGAAFRFLVLHNPYSTLFSFLALYAALRAIETRRLAWMVAAGSLASTTLLIEQSKGIGVFAGLLLAFTLVRLFDHSWQGSANRVLSFLLGGCLPIIATCWYFSAHHAFGVMLHDWIWPLQHYTKANHVPYGFQNWSDQTRDLIFHSGPLWLRIVKVLTVSPTLVVPVLPLVAVALLSLLAWKAWTRDVRSQHFAYYILVCSVCAGLLASVYVVRPDSLHFMYLAPIWYVVLAWILDAQGAGSKFLQNARPYLFAYVVISFGMLALASLLPARGARYRVETRRGIIKTNAEDTVVPYAQAHLATGEELLVYPYLPLYNYLTGTLSPSRYDFFQPGMNTPDQADQIIQSLIPDKAVLLQPAFSDTIPHSWADTPVSAIVNDPVTDFLVRNYRTCKVLRSPDNLGFWWMVPKNRRCS